MRPRHIRHGMSLPLYGIVWPRKHKLAASHERSFGHGNVPQEGKLLMVPDRRLHPRVCAPLAC